MNLLSRRSLLAIATVVDVASQAEAPRASAKAISSRHKLPPRHLETLLQGLVHAKILKGVRGPKGGYELARERDQISAGEIVRTALALSTSDPGDIGSQSKLLGKVIEPQVRKAGEPFLANLDAITVEQLCNEAERAHIH
jgi:Rrf2 family iron-sulfur cluster assembly transcriptional regulator